MSSSSSSSSSLYQRWNFEKDRWEPDPEKLFVSPAARQLVDRMVVCDLRQMRWDALVASMDAFAKHCGDVFYECAFPCFNKGVFLMKHWDHAAAVLQFGCLQHVKHYNYDTRQYYYAPGDQLVVFRPLDFEEFQKFPRKWNAFQVCIRNQANLRYDLLKLLDSLNLLHYTSEYIPEWKIMNHAIEFAGRDILPVIRSISITDFCVGIHPIERASQINVYTDCWFITWFLKTLLSHRQMQACFVFRDSKLRIHSHMCEKLYQLWLPRFLEGRYTVRADEKLLFCKDHSFTVSRWDNDQQQLLHRRILFYLEQVQIENHSRAVRAAVLLDSAKQWDANAAAAPSDVECQIAPTLSLAPDFPPGIVKQQDDECLPTVL
jgi:hypothetical protein